MKAPELLLPAGSLDKMRAAYDFGADAVYAGQPRYSLRARNNEFRMEQIAQGIQEAHQRGKKFFLTSNLIAHNDKIRTYLRDIEPIIAMKPDAMIMADPGLIMMVKEKWPEQEIHLSVQANTTNYATVKFWQKMGVSRIILSRELSLDEIEKIRQECPDMELEVFVHGALCIAYSGRCLLSGYFNRRDPNQGTCTNACRWDYKTHDAAIDPNTGEALGQTMENGFNFEEAKNDLDNQFTSTCGDQKRHPKADAIYLLEEKGRPGEMMPIMEDEHGTYIMNSKDLRAVQHVERLVQMGVHSLKIEGRTKSHYYVARTAQVYRKAIDDALAGRPFDKSLMDTLESLAHRGYTEGFLRRHVHDEYQNYERGFSLSERQQFVGELTGARRDGLAEVKVKNRFAVGDKLELMTPQGNLNLRLESLQNKRGEAIEVAPGDGHTVYLFVPEDVDLQYALLMRELDSTTTKG